MARKCSSVSARKAKGRRAAQEAKDLILASQPSLSCDDIIVTSSGVIGEDLVLSPRARSLLPLTFEMKNQEALNIWASLTQAESHVGIRDLTPVLVFRRNRSKLYVALEFEKFLKLYEKNQHKEPFRTELPRPDPSLS